jgi:choline dehydrogenase-like flavoprotein
MEPSPSPPQSLTSHPTTNFKVIIVGGSIAGLTLAHCLAKLPNIDFVVLEKRAEIAPQEGASVGILPHGGRILDQLGLFEEILRHVEPLTTAHVSYPDGFRHTNRSPTVLLERYVSPAYLPPYKSVYFECVCMLLLLLLLLMLLFVFGQRPY